MESVSEKVLLDVVVQWRVRAETGTVVHFNEPRFQVRVEHNVKPKDLEAERVLGILRLCRSHEVLDGMNRSKQCLHANLFDLLPELLRNRRLALCPTLFSVAIDLLEYCGEASLVADIVHLGINILLKVWVLLVDGVVGQVHEQVGQIIRPGANILYSGETRKAFFIDEAAEGRSASDEHVEAQVELEIIDQVWLVNVFLGNVMLIGLDPLVAPGQENANALTIELRFHNEGLRPVPIELFLEAFGVAGNHPSRGEEIVLRWQCFLHQRQVLC